MSVINISKELRRLSYAEMKVLAAELQKHLKTDMPIDEVATALSDLGIDLAKLENANTGEEAEVKALLKVFARKRAVYIGTANGQFVVSLSGGLKVGSPSLSSALGQFVDQVAALQAMGQKP